ncbi:MAG: hypothetical protein IT428_21585 [Planctomycetaceae bacterium]|nr:hypothetical protein [Planctomycetaceae bacterium]
MSYDRDADEFLRLLASFNRQRVKNTAEQLREEVVLMADDSCCQVRRFRRSAASVDAEGVDLGKRRRRSAIRDKLQLRAAMVKAVMDEQRNWPLSDRAVFYRLLNIKGLVRNDRTRLKFENSEAFNDDVTNMLTRLRLDGSIPFESIADETRPVVIWDTHRCRGLRPP